MATLFGRMRSISRGAGSSAMTAAAYRSCSQLVRIITDKETGLKSDITYDYSDKKGLVFSRIFASRILFADANNVDIPAWIFDRQSLWQRIEDVETRVNSELAKEYVLALPKELSIEQNIELLTEFVETSFLSRGMVVDVNYHADNPNNPHAHIMFPMRMLEVNEQGEIDFGAKVREWKSFALLNQIKQEQRIIINEYYAKNGFEYNLQWGVPDGLEATFHHGGIKNLWRSNQEIIARNAGKIVTDPSLVIDKLDYNKAVFTTSDIEQEIEKVLQINVMHLKGEEYKRYKESLDEYLQIEKLKMLNVVLLSPKLRIVNPCDLKGRMLFAKTKQVELEERFIGHIEDLNSRNNHKIEISDEDILPLQLGTDKVEFTVQQKEVIKKVLAGSDISIIEGWPGAGKSTVTREIVRHYRERGFEIIIAAPTNKAAQELEDKLGCCAYTLAALRMKWQFERGFETDIALRADYYKEESYADQGPIMSEKSILIIDEISMVDTPNFDYFASEAVKSGAKIIGLGDNNQNQAIGMKGASAKAIEIAGSNLLTEINRHKNENEEIRQLHIEASSSLSRYQVTKALSIYEQLGAIKICENEGAKEEAIFRDYMEQLFTIAHGDIGKISAACSKIVMIAYTNAEIDRLNVLVRESLKRSGVLTGGRQFISGGIYGGSEMVELCVGDQIIFKTNQPLEDGYGGVMNNEIAVVKKILSVSASGVGEFVAEIRRAGDGGGGDGGAGGGPDGGGGRDGRDGRDGGSRRVVIRTGQEGRPISFRHGYAITNYAVQGADIDYALMSIDKHSGYEVVVVGLTRHKLVCRIYAAQDSLEDEVYRSKELDVLKVREEYRAIAYKWQEKRGENGKVYFEKEEVPLWKIGLSLLAAKRSNLNFALDSDYSRVSREEYDKLGAIHVRLEILREELNQLEEELFEYEKVANSVIDTGTSTGTSTDTEIYSRMELFALQHFNLTAGEIVFCGRLVNLAPTQYMQIAFEASAKGEDELSIEEHIKALQIGILKNGTRQKLRWEDLTELDQNLVLHSYLEQEEREYLAQHLEKIESLEHQIKEYAGENSTLLASLGAEAKTSHKKLTGNYAAVRDYLEARTEVRELYKQYKDKSQAQKLLLNKQSRQDVSVPAEMAVKLLVKEQEVKKIAEKLQQARATRQATALVLINNYHNGTDHNGSNQSSHNGRQSLSIAKLVAQVNCNYQTIAKHAAIKDERYYFKQIEQGTLRKSKHYSNLMRLVAKASKEDLTLADGKELLASHHELVEASYLIAEYLTELKAQEKVIMEEQRLELKTLQQHKLFKLTEFNGYIGSIYKTSQLEVIETLDNLLKNTMDRGQLILAISDSPEMLGEVQDRGLFAKIFNYDDVKKLEQRLDIFPENVKRYVEGEARMVGIEDRVNGGYYQQKLDAIDAEITKLQSEFASKKEAELLEHVSKIENHHMRGGMLDEIKFASDISKLFREDEALDLLFNWQVYSEQVRGRQGKEISNAASSSMGGAGGVGGWTRLDFNEVARSLTSHDFETIFRTYAGRINSDGRIVKKGSSIACGSLNMNLRNGLWHRFSSGDRGNIFIIAFITYFLDFCSIIGSIICFLISTISVL